MNRLVVLGGSGDAYLVFALLAAYRRLHTRPDALVVVRARLAAVGDLFGLPYAIDDALVAQAEADHGLHGSYANEFGGDPYYVHPCFVRTPVRVDRLTTRWEASQADMYRMILRLPFDEPLALPAHRGPGEYPVNSRSVVIITDSTSWPNTQPDFWNRLANALIAERWQVHVNDRREDLGTLLDRCRRAAWVIGPQCGVMSIVTTGQFQCRKTLATPNIDSNRRPEYLAAETFPYGYVTKFSNHDFDCEEFKISDHDHAELIQRIVHGANGQCLWPHDPSPVMTVQAPLAPGDFFDRLAVLTVKRDRFDPRRRAAIEREYQRLVEIRRQLPTPPEVDELFRRLVKLHGECYDLLARIVPQAVGAGELSTIGHVAAIRANKTRVELKQAIDAACHSPYSEVKDYYDGANLGRGGA